MNEVTRVPKSSEPAPNSPKLRLPGGVGEEAEAELGDRRRGAVDHLVGDQDDHDHREQRRRQADAVEQPVADPVGFLATGRGPGSARAFSDAAGAAVALIGAAA